MAIKVNNEYFCPEKIFSSLSTCVCFGTLSQTCAWLVKKDLQIGFSSSEGAFKLLMAFFTDYYKKNKRRVFFYNNRLEFDGDLLKYQIKLPENKITNTKIQNLITNLLVGGYTIKYQSPMVIVYYSKQ